MRDLRLSYLKSLQSIREQSKIFGDLAERNELQHFIVEPNKWNNVVDFVVELILRDHPKPDGRTLPRHCRWQHFTQINGDGKSLNKLTLLLDQWKTESVNDFEIARRITDITVLSVLIDAGAGNKWRYLCAETQKELRRSEGLAQAAWDMIKSGMFSSSPDNIWRVDATGISKITLDTFKHALQITQGNEILGLEGRWNLLQRLAQDLKCKEFFGQDERVGNIVDWILKDVTGISESVSVSRIWYALMEGFPTVWTQNAAKLDGVALGDAWYYPATSTSLEQSKEDWKTIRPFHKLAQWMCYSLVEVLQRTLNIRVRDTELLTGLAEYRNGGLLIDSGYLKLREQDKQRGMFQVCSHTQECNCIPIFRYNDQVIIEWRGITIQKLDKLLHAVNCRLELTGAHAINMSQLLEVGSWKAGRELVQKLRPNTLDPPIRCESDGTIF